jgi:hypothetical protein
MERFITSNKKVGPNLPESIRQAILMAGYAEISYIRDKGTGQPGTFLRSLIRQQMEDAGRMPSNSDTLET